MILIVDDDKVIRLSLSMLLKRAGYATLTASNAPEAVDAVRSHAFKLIIMDMNYSRNTTGEEGLELLRKVKIFQPEVPVILITAWGNIPLAVEGMKAGAFDFITKPWNNYFLLQRVETALKLTESLPADNKNTDGFDRAGIIGTSRGLLDVLSTVKRIAATDAPVLVTGETGTGKELIARAVHLNSRRKNGPLITVNLGGISQSLFESEMFGHAKGSFTGAIANRKGRFELADTGTIFLDEIGDLDMSCQVKLLRVLQQHTFEALGDSTPRKTDIRVVCATNADLPAMVAAGRFREDLLYRINLITLHLPPLRERREDIPLLVRHFASMSERPGIEFSGDAMTLLTGLPYYGNIRELKNIVERTILVTPGNTITATDIEHNMTNIPLQSAPEQPAPLSGMTLEDMERTAIRQAIADTGGNLTQMASKLGITRQSLYRRMEKYGIKL
ncbi:MAG: sigma-54-dependent Fis family transcriptional regulator [Muribaculaceae bacterium]|nr:sigma-54-dependent Fis family transcriptional regulator [Muribaculaceae bacterium]